MRKPRKIVANATYHVTARINRSEMLFAEMEFYKELFLEYVAKAKNKYSFFVNNICIMDNHIHLQIKPFSDSQLCNIMKSILGGFARKYNQINGLKGHVWYDRFKSRVIETFNHFCRTFIYIANNPVRANIVDNPLKYAYSGFAYLFSKENFKIKQHIQKLFSVFLDPPDKDLLNIVNGYLGSFNKKLAQEIDTDIGFYDKKTCRSCIK